MMWIKNRLRLIFLVVVMLFVIERHQTLASPLFFDNLFPFQSTTPESVISDYRSQRRADSNADHQMPVNIDSEMVDVEPTKQYTENNVEFYAEIIGKLFGKVRDSFTGLISSVQQRNQQLKEKLNKSALNKDKMPMKSEIKRHEDDGSKVGAIKDITVNSDDNNSTMKQQDEKQHQQAINAMENAIKMQMTNETVSLSLLKLNGTTAPFEIELMPMKRTELNGDKSVGGKNQQVKANKIVKGEVVQVIARRSKQKRSETLSEYVEQIGHSDLAIPYVLNQQQQQQQEDDNEEEQRQQQLEQEHDNNGQSTEQINQNSKSDNLLSHSLETHRQRKAKFLKLMLSFILKPLITPAFNQTNDGEEKQHSRSLFNNLNEISNDDDGTMMGSNEGEELANSNLDDNKLSLVLLRGNTTIHKTPLELFKIFKHYKDTTNSMEMNETIQMRTKVALQSAFYKYARIFLIARKGFKDASNTDNHKSDDKSFTKNTILTQQPSNEYEHNIENHYKHSDEQLEDEYVATSTAKANLQAMEMFAIFVLEIIGAIIALTHGAVTHWQAGFFNDN